MSAGYANYLDFYRRGPYAPYVNEYRLAGGAVPVRAVDLSQPGGDFEIPPLPDLILHLTKKTVSFDLIDIGDGRWSWTQNSGDMWLAPPEVSADFVIGGSNAFLSVAMPEAEIRSVIKAVDPNHVDFGRLHAAPFRDAFIETLALRLWAEAAQGSPAGTLFADSLVQTLALALLRKAEVAVDQHSEADDGFVAARLSRCLDYMDEHLSTNIRLNEIAAIAGLSPLYFPRAFRRATGMAPYQYLAQRRVERAKQLLITTDAAVAEIALACGFCDQSHLTRWFKRLVKVTPAAFRAQARH